MFDNALYVEVTLIVLTMCAFIPLWVFFVLGWSIVEDNISQVENENDAVELCWTFIPSVSVFFLSILNTQCMIVGLLPTRCPVVKVVGHQWYWSYDVGDTEIEYDSVMSDVLDGVDKPLRIPAYRYCALAVTSADVIHSFSLPEFNVKTDAIPGRVNQVRFYPSRVGVFVGYCTELCGAGHGYMPVVLEVVSDCPSSWV